MMLLVFWQFDPLGNKVGGIGKYVLSFIGNIPKNQRLGIIGVTTIRNEVGKWKTITVGGRNVEFLPVCYIKDENVKSFFPLSIKFCLGLLFYKYKISSDSVFFHQRAEYILPLYFMSNKQYLMIHFDLFDYLDKKNGESVWRKFPIVFKFLISFMLKRMRVVFSVSNNSIDYLARNFKNLKDKLMYAPTWADSTIFNYEKKLALSKISMVTEKFKIPQSQNYILVVGRLNEQKNIQLILDIISKIESAIVLVIGDGPSKKSLEDKTDKLGLAAKVLFLGRLTQQEIKDLYYLPAIYLSTSLTEGMSVALLESLSMGVPVITTPTGESQSIIKQGNNGYVSSQWSSEELTQYVVQILEGNFKSDRLNIIRSSKEWSSKKTIPLILGKMGLQIND